MKTEIERARESIKEYRKGYGQPQLPTDCIIQLMMGHAKSEQLILSGVVKSDSEQFTPNDVKLPKENKPISMHTDSKKPLNKKV